MASLAIAIRKLCEKTIQVLVPHKEFMGRERVKKRVDLEFCFIGIEGGCVAFWGSLCTGEFKTVIIKSTGIDKNKWSNGQLWKPIKSSKTKEP